MRCGAHKVTNVESPKMYTAVVFRCMRAAVLTVFAARFATFFLVFTYRNHLQVRCFAEKFSHASACVASALFLVVIMLIVMLPGLKCSKVLVPCLILLLLAAIASFELPQFR